MMVEILMDKSAYLVPSTKRDLHACPHNLSHPFRLDWSEKMEIHLGENEGEENLPIDSFTSLPELRDWISGWNLEDNWYYLLARGLYTHAKPMRKQSDRMLRKLRHKVGRPRNLRRQARFEAWVCLLKFETMDGECVEIFSHQSERRRAPYKTPKYIFLKWIDERMRNPIPRDLEENNLIGG